MDWKTFIAELVKALAWPGLVGTLFFAYRKHILRILIIAIRMLRRVQTLKYGDIEIAMRSVNAAIEANETKAAIAEVELSNPETPPDERERLAKELRSAVEEAANLRTAVDALVSGSESKSEALYSPATSHSYKHKLLMGLVRELGAKQIVTLWDAGDKDVLIARAQAAFRTKILTAERYFGKMPRLFVINEHLKMINSDGSLTEKGLKELHELALRQVLARSSA
ncbi:hypothetical protein QYQ99_27155 [Comamonas testosteroni]|uniref:hypothetical protein n=1 Tax=Comamonas testosteroni TaxID=285 RepID=UPI0026601048|nr:hypothetical protein [Comamonas testosteroni]WKL15944.1 hypothetical protein QYQ99_27155 [Comamonas testosteroni]